MPTVRDLIRKALPPDAKVVAGESELYAEIGWVITLKPYPPGFDGIKGNEFAIVAADVAAGLGVAISRLISTLAEQKVGAIGVIGEVSAEARRQAQLKHIPLIQLASQTSASALEADIMRNINEERHYLYQKEREFSQSLMELAVTGGESAAILKRLQELSGRNIGFIDINLKPHFFLDSSQIADFQKILQPVLTSSSGGSPVVGMDLSPEFGCFFGPVKVGKTTKGYLVLIAPEAEISEIDRLAIRIGTMALAVEMSRRQVAEEIEDRYEADIIEAINIGELSEEALCDKAKKLNFDLSLTYAAIDIRLTVSPSEKPVVLQKVAGVLPKFLSYFRDEDLILLYPVKSSITPAELRSVGEKLAIQIAGIKGKNFCSGIGRPYSGPEGIRLSLQEAEQALNMGCKIFGDGNITCFADLGIYRLLFSLKSSPELISFYHEYLDILVEYDQQHGGELLDTLKAYLHFKNVAESARAIHVHRNTLLYRLDRIREITGCDLEDGETLFALHLALLAGDVIRIS